MTGDARHEQRAVTGRGRCLCGAVRYTVHGTLRDRMSACHCHMCRRHHGGLGYYTSVETRDEIAIEDGNALRWYESSPGTERGFCQICGSTLFIREQQRAVVDIASGTLDEMPEMKVTQHIYVASKGDYYEIADAIPQYAEGRPDL